jgi:hypothetical protein
MSLATFKKKSINRYSSATKRSGKPPGGYWLPQGPFGSNNSINSVILADASTHYGPVGFSIQGGHRSISVGKTMKFSQQGTRFRGIHPMGHGGRGGQYYQAEPLFNAGQGIIEVRGNQQQFIKPSVLSTKGMLAKRFRWVASGQYPNNWVQPNYTGNLTDSASQGLYIHNLSVASDCVVDTNDTQKYVGNIKTCGSMGCNTTPARGYTMGIQQANAAYTKFLHIPQDSSQRTIRVQRRCIDQRPGQKPFPYAVQTGTGILTGGTSVTTVGSACNTSNTYTAPPAWYLLSKSQVQ